LAATHAKFASSLQALIAAGTALAANAYREVTVEPLLLQGLKEALEAATSREGGVDAVVQGCIEDLHAAIALMLGTTQQPAAAPTAPVLTEDGPSGPRPEGSSGATFSLQTSLNGQ
jgi:hypothetical protein